LVATGFVDWDQQFMGAGFAVQFQSCKIFAQWKMAFLNLPATCMMIRLMNWISWYCFELNLKR